MKLSPTELALAFLFAVMGLIFSTRTFLFFMNGLNPVFGFLVYYGIVYGLLYVLGRLGLVVFNIKITDALQTFGLLMITFSFFLTTNWSSPYVQYVLTGSYAGPANIFVNNSEDSLVWWFWSLFFSDVTLLRILVFGVSPFVITVVGGLLVSRKIKIGS